MCLGRVQIHTTHSIKRLQLHLPAGWLLGEADNHVNHQNDAISQSQSCYHFVLPIALGTGYPPALPTRHEVLEVAVARSVLRHGKHHFQ